MASEFFRSFIGDDITAIYGLTPDAMWVLITFVMAVGIAIFLQQRIGGKDIGVFGFLAMLFVGAFIGMVDFLVIAIPLVFTMMIYWGTRGRGT